MRQEMDAAAQERAQMIEDLKRLAEEVKGREWGHSKKRLVDGKDRLKSVQEYTKFTEWITFQQQVRLAVGSVYPFTTTWMHCMRQLSEPPSAAFMFELQSECQCTEEEWADFARDIWAVLGMKVKGAGLTVLDHVMSRMTSPADVALMPFVAWYELEQDAQGRLPEHKLELRRAVDRPERVKTWAEVPTAIRQWETKENELELLTGTPLDDTAKVQALFDMLPMDLYRQSRAQSNVDGFRTLRSYVLRQITLAANAGEKGRKPH